MTNYWRIGVPVLAACIGVSWFVTVGEVNVVSDLVEVAGMAAPIWFIVLGTFLLCLFVPKTFVSLAAGGLFGFLTGSFVLILTALVSAWVNYHLGRWSLRQRESQRVPLLVREIGKTAGDAGLGFHLMARLMPVPTTVISYAMGAARARWLPYLGGALLGALPQLLWVYCGTAAREVQQLSERQELSAVRIAAYGISLTAAVLMSIVVPGQVLRRWRATVAGRRSDSPVAAS